MKVYILLSILYIITKNENEAISLIQDKEIANRIDVVEHFNQFRFNAAKQLNAKLMYELKMDGSLNYLAEETLKNCDQDTIDDEGYRKIRFQMFLYEDKHHTNTVDYDFFDPAFEFEEHVKNNGPSFANIKLEYQTLYELFYANQTMIGCGFKMCAYSETRIFNMLCYLGPKKTLEGSFIEIGAYECGEQLCQKERKNWREKGFQKHIVDYINSGRRAVAKAVSAANMYEMVWDDKLAEKVKKFADKCIHKPIKRSRFVIIPVYPAVSSSASKEKNRIYTERFGKLPGIEDEEKKALFWWNHTKIGCARAVEKCGDVFYCAIGKRPKYYGKQFEIGELCSYCLGSCDDGLCFKIPKTNGTASLWNISCLIVIAFFSILFSQDL